MMTLHRSLKHIGSNQWISIYCAVAVLFVGLTLALTQYFQSSRLSALNAENNRHIYMQRLAATLTNQNQDDFQRVLNEWPALDSIAGIRITDTRQNILAQSGDIQSISGLYQLSFGEGLLLKGAITAELKEPASSSIAKQTLFTSVIITLIFSGIAALIGHRFVVHQHGYVRQLRQKLINWQGGDPLILPACPPQKDLQSLHETLAKLASKDERKQALEGVLGRFMAGTRQTELRLKYYSCAMLFVEIQDLEELQTRLSADELSNALNHYYRLLNRAAKLYNGRVERLFGDGAIVYFGLPKENSAAALHCLQAAQLFIGLTNSLRNMKCDHQIIDFNIGAHWGHVLMTPLQDGHDKTCDFVGESLHSLYQLCQHGQEQRILASQTLVEHCATEANCRWSDGLLINDLRGKQHIAFWLEGLPSKSEALIRNQIQHINSMTEEA